MNALQLKNALLKGYTPIGTWVFEFNSPGIARLLASTNIDFVVYDMEHSGFGIETIRHLISHNRAVPLTCLVRPPAGEYHLIAPLLDLGADGVLVPRVETKTQAENIVASCRYFPDGKRGGAFGIAHDDFLAGDIPSKIKIANESVICGVLIETQRAVENLDEILTVRGIDLVWIGFLDLSISMGIAGDVSDSRFQESIATILAACQARDIPVGVIANDVTQAVAHASQGFRVISYSADLWLLQRVLTEGCDRIRSDIAMLPTFQLRRGISL